MYAQWRSENVETKPNFMRNFGITSRQYNTVKYTLDGMESSIKELRPGRISDNLGSHEEWQDLWHNKRSSQFFILGSKDEESECQECVITHISSAKFLLCIRLPGLERCENHRRESSEKRVHMTSHIEKYVGI